MLVRTSTIGALGRLRLYRRVLCEHWGGSAGTEVYYMSTREAVLIQQSTQEAVLEQQRPVGALGSLCWYSRVLKQRSRGCGGTPECYRSTLEAGLVEHNPIGTIERLCY